MFDLVLFVLAFGLVSFSLYMLQTKKWNKTQFTIFADIVLVSVIIIAGVATTGLLIYLSTIDELGTVALYQYLFKSLAFVVGIIVIVASARLIYYIKYTYKNR